MKIQSEKDLEIISNEYRQGIYHPGAIKVNIGMASCGKAAGDDGNLGVIGAVVPLDRTAGHNFVEVVL